VIDHLCSGIILEPSKSVVDLPAEGSIFIPPVDPVRGLAVDPARNLAVLPARGPLVPRSKGYGYHGLFAFPVPDGGVAFFGR
jgi:hypothetical protein